MMYYHLSQEDHNNDTHTLGENLIKFQIIFQLESNLMPTVQFNFLILLRLFRTIQELRSAIKKTLNNVNSMQL